MPLQEYYIVVGGGGTPTFPELFSSSVEELLYTIKQVILIDSANC